MPINYPLDLSGVSPVNLIKDEVHTTSEARFRDYNFIVPNLAPFYVDNFSIRTTGPEARALVEDVDFSFALPYTTGTRVTGKQMYGAVTLHNLDLNGILAMDYQTIGGDQVADRLHVLTFLADKAYNPRTTVWDIITNVPTAFPPTPHYQDYDNFYGQEQLVGMLAEIRDAILSNSSLTAEKLREFLGAYNNERGGYVSRTGDRMSGPLHLLPGPPGADDHAVNKAYVDARVGGLGDIGSLLSTYVKDVDFHLNMNYKLNLTGGIMTGPLALHADPINDDQPTTKRYVDQAIRSLSDRIEALQQRLDNQTYLTREQAIALIDEVTLRFSSYK